MNTQTRKCQRLRGTFTDLRAEVDDVRVHGSIWPAISKCLTQVLNELLVAQLIRGLLGFGAQSGYFYPILETVNLLGTGLFS